MKTIYLDNNATTAVAPEVREAMLPYLTDLYGNPSSMHTFGGQVGRAVEEARERMAALLGAHPDEIIFTSCGSESDNAAIWSALQTQPEKRHLITTRVEHPAILNVAQYWERQGYRVTLLGVDSKGRLDLDEYAAALSDDTALVSIMYANNEVGNVFPISRMAEMAAEKGVLFHTDAVQAVGKEAIDLGRQPISMLSLSGHKLHAPKGIGVLYVRKGVRFRPFLRGGHQERGRRAGTENVPYIVGLGMAAQLAGQHMQEERTRVARLRDKLEQGLLAAIPDCMVNGDPENRLPNTTNIAFKNVEGEAILLMLDQLGICASSGSACTSGSLEPSHVLRAMGVPFNYAPGSVRLSLSRYTTEEEIDFVIENMPLVIKTLRDISQAFTNRIEPRVVPAIERLETEGGKAYVKVSFAGDDRPYACDGRYRIRSADEDLPVGAALLEQMMLERAAGRSPWDRRPSGRPIADVDEDTLRAYVERGVERGRIPFPYIDARDALSRLGLFCDDDILTNRMLLRLARPHVAHGRAGERRPHADIRQPSGGGHAVRHGQGCRDVHPEQHAP